MSVPPVQPGLSYAAAGSRPEPAVVVGQGGGGVASTAANVAVAVPAAPADPLMAALSQALGAAAARQDGLAPLFANLEALVGRGDAPQPLREAAQALLTLRLSSAALDGGALRQAIARAGMLVEAMAAKGLTPEANVKSALQDLRGVLLRFLGGESASPETKDASPLPPPFRGALPVAQPPVMASIVDTGLRQAAIKVLDQTEAAIARHVMLQIASLPASQQPSHPPDDHTQRLVFDIPLVTPQGTSVVQIQIEREAPQREAQTPVWSVRFAVDLEPIGPVRARVAQIGGKTGVTLVAEKPESAAALQQDIGSLQAALKSADLDPGDLHCLSHDQTRVTAPQGQFVNRAS